MSTVVVRGVDEKFAPNDLTLGDTQQLISNDYLNLYSMFITTGTGTHTKYGFFDQLTIERMSSLIQDGGISEILFRFYYFEAQSDNHVSSGVSLTPPKPKNEYDIRYNIEINEINEINRSFGALTISAIPVKNKLTYRKHGVTIVNNLDVFPHSSYNNVALEYYSEQIIKFIYCIIGEVFTDLIKHKNESFNLALDPLDNI